MEKFAKSKKKQIKNNDDDDDNKGHFKRQTSKIPHEKIWTWLRKGNLKRLVGWVLWYINLCRLFNAKSIFMKIVLFQTIRFCIST